MEKRLSKNAFWLALITIMAAIIFALVGCSPSVQDTKIEGTGTGTTGNTPATINETKTTKVQAPTKVTFTYPNDVVYTRNYTYTNMGFVETMTEEGTNTEPSYQATSTYAHSEDGLVSGFTYENSNGDSYGATVDSTIKHDNDETEWTEFYHFDAAQAVTAENAYLTATQISREITRDVSTQGYMTSIDDDTIYEQNGQRRESDFSYEFDNTGRLTMMESEDDAEGQKTAKDSEVTYSITYEGTGDTVTATVKPSVGGDSFTMDLTYENGKLVKIVDPQHEVVIDITYTEVEADTLAAAYLTVLPSMFLMNQ